MHHHVLRLFCLVGALTASADSLSAQAPTPKQIEFFENQIRPQLVEHCYACHSQAASEAGKLKGGLSLDDRAGLLRGGESGAVVVPGNSRKSLLMSALRHDDFEMPPKGKLPDNVIADFAKWIDMGAPDPRDGKGVIHQTIDLERGREFWCFQPLASVTAPPNTVAPWNRTDIDRWVYDGLVKQSIEPVGVAPPSVLVRRVFYDLIGMPPSPEQLQRWVASLERDASAFATLVDELLASPRFGERWGRHWLDVARYAESNGNSRNATFPHAWRYRDYVIDAFNNDTPYDQFVQQQVAGDLLPYESPAERNRNLIATGFLAMGSKPVIRGKSGGFIPDIAADQIEVVTRSVLGLTVSCARCHDHKFDPIPTTDYYGLAGIFASSDTLYGGGGKAMGGAPATGLHTLVSDDRQQAEKYDAWKKEVDDATKLLQKLNAEKKKLRPRKGKDKGKGKGKGKTRAKRKADANAQGKAADAKAMREKLAAVNAQIKQQTTRLNQLRSKAPATPNVAMGIRDRTVLEVPVYVRGESPKGDKVSRRLLTVLTNSATVSFPADQSGRLELAQWLASDDNALAARVMANRTWQHLMGRGIVGTPDNFGVNGDRPSHPKLLDHLAASFVKDGWSVKRLIRQIVLTRTYQLSNDFQKDAAEKDPLNVSLWRHSSRRLEAEAIRDAILTASGKLEVERPTGSVVAEHGGKLIQDALTPDKIHRPSNHRSVYLPVLRNGLPESLEVFDMADPSLVVGRRDVTIVPSQDLYMMNSPFVVDQSREFATRVMAATDDDAARIELAYLIALSRKPGDDEIQRATEFKNAVETSLADDSSAEHGAWTALCQALFVSTEFRNTQ